MRIDWKTVGRCISRVRTVLEPDITCRFDNLVNIGVDETSYRKGHNYVTTVVNHDTNCVVWVHNGHGKAVLSEFFDALTPEQRASIKAVSGDGARWIDDCIQEYIPHATRCVDPFHVVSWGSEALDEIRREVWRDLEARARAKKTQANKVKNSKKNNAKDKANKLSEQAGSLNKLAESVKKAAYTLYKRQDELTPADLCRIGQLHAADPKIIKAFILQDRLRQLFQGFTREVAQPRARRLDRICQADGNTSDRRTRREDRTSL